MDIRALSAGEFPNLLREIPQPPTQLYLRGQLPDPELRLLSIVGSRKYTSYGKQAVEQLVAGLAGQPVGIISGLALGIDSLAHEAALRNSLYTLAIPGGGLNNDVIYPAQHKPLARRILEARGGLLSEYEPDFRATRWSFTARNRLVAGISHATLLVEAAEKSGTLITARLATDYNREVLGVPGSIFSKTSEGVHQFIKLGATPVTTSGDILEALGLDTTPAASTRSLPDSLSPLETTILEALHEPVERDTLIRVLNHPVPEVTATLMQMEMQGYIALSDGYYQSLM